MTGDTKNSAEVVSVENLSISFTVEGRKLQVVEDLSFSIAKGEILALVGESGCGKTVSCLSLARLLPEPPASYDSGSIRFRASDGSPGENVLDMSPSRIREIRRRRLAYIFQEPSVSLNPVFTIYDQIAEVIGLRDTNDGNPEEEVASLLAQVGIPDPVSKMKCYPHELSGGMQQRAMIAMALAGKPDLLVADEPTTALDVTIQAQILDLISKIRRESSMSVLIVTHNLGIVSDMADSVIVMYAGHVVEKGPAPELISSPIHPYTRALLDAVPRFGCEPRKLSTIPGNVPSPSNYPRGCRFFGRCPLAESLGEAERAKCASSKPQLLGENGRFSRCHFSR